MLLEGKVFSKLKAKRKITSCHTSTNSNKSENDCRLLICPQSPSQSEAKLIKREQSFITAGFYIQALTYQLGFTYKHCIHSK